MWKLFVKFRIVIYAWLLCPLHCGFELLPRAAQQATGPRLLPYEVLFARTDLGNLDLGCYPRRRLCVVQTTVESAYLWSSVGARWRRRTCM